MPGPCFDEAVMRVVGDVVAACEVLGGSVAQSLVERRASFGDGPGVPGAYRDLVKSVKSSQL